MLNVKYVKKVEKGFFDRDVDRTNRTQGRVKLICYMTLSRTWNQDEKPSNLLLYRKSCEVWGKNPSNMKRFNRHSMSLRFMTPNRGCIPESTDNRPRDLFRGSLGMFLSSLLFERKCLKIDLFKIDCCLNVSFIICVFFFMCWTQEQTHAERSSR